MAEPTANDVSTDLKAILMDRIVRLPHASNCAEAACMYARQIRDIDFQEQETKRRKRLESEMKRLWMLLAPEYNSISGHTDLEWLDDDEVRYTCLQLLEACFVNICRTLCRY